MSPEQAENLLRRYRKGDCTPEELELVEVWAARLAAQPGREWQPGEKEIVKERMEAAIQESIGTTGVGGRIGLTRAGRRIGPAWRWLAAAVFIAVMAFGWFFITRRPGHDNMQPVTVTARPGSDRAVLTLGDGRQVTMDSSYTGVVADQSGAKVTSMGRGLLKYDGTGEEKFVYNSLDVPRGGQYRLVLPDGTEVWLNSASRLRYPTVFTGDRREVELTGEGYFNVKREPGKPFFVRTGGTLVQVMGTSFNVMSYADEPATRVTLVDGAVAVAGRGTRKVLRPGEQASLQGEELVIARPDLREVLAWKDGDFRFSGMEIRAIMRQLSRWYDLEVVYEGSIPVSQFGGVLPKRSDLKDVLAALETAGGVKFKVVGQKVVVSNGTSN